MDSFAPSITCQPYSHMGLCPHAELKSSLVHFIWAMQMPRPLNVSLDFKSLEHVP